MTVETVTAQRHLPDGRLLEAEAEVDTYRYTGPLCQSAPMREIQSLALSVDGAPVAERDVPRDMIQSLEREILDERGL